MSDLREHPDVQALIDTLDKNGLTKEKEEVASLADYIVDIEKTLSGMLIEMQAMRNEVNLIHNSSLRARCGRLVDKAENSIKQAINVIRSVKDKFVESSKSALQTFKKKGKDALQKAVNGMKIPETLDKLKSFFQRVSKSLEQDAKQIDLMRSELNKSKTHFKNFGRALFGREVKEAEFFKCLLYKMPYLLKVNIFYVPIILRQLIFLLLWFNICFCRFCCFGCINRRF